MRLNARPLTLSREERRTRALVGGQGRTLSSLETWQGQGARGQHNGMMARCAPHGQTLSEVSGFV